MSQRYIKSFLKYVLFKLPLLLVSLGFLMVITGALILIFKTNQPAITQTAWSDVQVVELNPAPTADAPATPPAELTLPPVAPTQAPTPTTPAKPTTSPTPTLSPTVLPTRSSTPAPSISPTPAQAPSNQVQQPSQTYTVQAGDSWWKIAEQQLGNGYSYKKLAAYNQRSTKQVLHIGVTLQLPDQQTRNQWLAELPPAHLTPAANSSVSLPSTLSNLQPASTYVVQTGDCLWTIAEQHLGSGYSWTSLYTANQSQISDPDLIFPGQTLTLPQMTQSYSPVSQPHLIQ